MFPRDEADLPEMSDALLGPEEVAALFRDYRACASGLQIQVKSGAGLVTPQASPTLAEAEEALRARRVRGLQIRYDFGGVRWCDTLMPLDAGVRLVRIQA